MTIRDNLLTIKERIAQCEKQFHHAVTLLAVSKGQSLEKMQAAIAAGQRCFGENYLQEALEKMARLSDPTIEWHFTGKIQRNKTKKIAEHFAWVQTIDDIRIAKRLNDQRPAHLAPLNVCIEINISHEGTKPGIQIEAIQPLADAILQLPRLHLRGLMASPPAMYQTTVHEEFHKLFIVWQSLRTTYPSFDTLSMGMTDDFEDAIAEGSTLVRIGRAIFGERE